MSKILRIILGDQLNENHSWFHEYDSEDFLYALFEVKQETGYVKHHIQKVVSFFLAMRSFAQNLKNKGFQVEYFKITDSRNSHNFIDNIRFLIKKHSILKIEYQLPDEHRLDAYFNEELSKLDIPFEAFDTEHFYTSREELTVFSEGKKNATMEDFYRYMRKKHSILIEKGKPVGEKWNYDTSNRKKWRGDKLVPTTYSAQNDCKELLSEIESVKIKTFGSITNKTINYAVTRKQSLEQLEYFCEHLLAHFGDYQDAMHTTNSFLFHSKISFALNVKLLSPKEVVNAVINAFYANESIHISQVEGFVRQVLGWREYMRGVYWQYGKAYKKENFFKNKNKLPQFYWDANTQMNCVKHCVTASLNNSYAHHIQRLMVLGNLALLLEVDPAEVDAWYLGVYIDAVEWVQLPNTRGMSQFADGGKIATKPYVSSANYIFKMSNYCKDCVYNYKTKTEEDSCPFNSLYWAFLHRNKKLLNRNHRMAMMYSLLEKLEVDKSKFESILQRATSIKNNSFKC